MANKAETPIQIATNVRTTIVACTNDLETIINDIQKDIRVPENNEGDLNSVQTLLNRVEEKRNKINQVINKHNDAMTRFNNTPSPVDYQAPTFDAFKTKHIPNVNAIYEDALTRANILLNKKLEAVNT